MRHVGAIWVVLLAVGCGGDTDDGGGGSGGASGGSGGASGGSAGSGGSATGGSGGAASVVCGSTACSAGQYCCEPSCVAVGSACSGFALHCDDASDCPGALCCAAPPAGGGFPVAECRPSCDGDGEMIVCRHADAASCPAGMQCQITAKLPPEYGFCQ